MVNPTRQKAFPDIARAPHRRNILLRFEGSRLLAGMHLQCHFRHVYSLTIYYFESSVTKGFVRLTLGFTERLQTDIVFLPLSMMLGVFIICKTNGAANPSGPL